MKSSITCLLLCSLTPISSIWGSSSSSPIVSSHQDSADTGSTQVIDNTNAGYNLIQSATVTHGANAFQLAHYNVGDLDDSFVLVPRFSVTADTKLFFQSRLRFATTGQHGKVEISTNNGSSWTEIFNVSGTGGDTETSFTLKTISLSAYAGQNICIRFTYTHSSGSLFAVQGNTTSAIGWFIDNVQVGTSFQKDIYDFGSPSNDEQLYIETLNRARASASAEASRLAAETDADVLNAYSFFSINTSDIISQYAWNVSSGCMDEVAQPLAPNKILMQAALLHSLDMKNNLFQGHDSSSSPPSPFAAGDSLSARVNKLGYSWASLSENVFASERSVVYGHAGFAVDWGNTTNTSSSCYNAAFAGQGMQNPPGHRLSIHKDSLKEVGVGIQEGTGGGFGPRFVTQDFGTPASTVAFVTGVVHNDGDTDSFYDVGEGLSGFRVDVDTSTFYTNSSASGGYALPVATNGSVLVSFSIGGSVVHTETRTIAGLKNIKVDYRPTGYALWVKNNHPTMIGGLTGDDDGDGVPNLLEYAFHLNSNDSTDASTATGTVTVNGSMDSTLTSDLPSARSDLTYVARWSVDLENWYDITPTFPAGKISATITRSAAAAQLSVPTSDIKHIFMCWKVTR